MRFTVANFKSQWFGLHLIFALCLFSSSIVAQTDTPPEKISPKSIVGTIVDEKESPVVAASVQITLASWDEEFDKRIVHLKKLVETDKEGRFQLDVKEAVPKDRVLFCNVLTGTKLHFKQSFDFQGEEVWKEKVDVGSLKLFRGVRVKGRLVGPGGATELDTPTVSLWVEDYLTEGAHPSFYRDINCDEDGTFECLVPNQCSLRMVLGSYDFAQSKVSKNIEAAAATDPHAIPVLDLGSMPLKQGVSVSGKATLKDGSPAKGVVVLIAEREDGADETTEPMRHIDTSELKHLSTVKTDEKGDFELPPHLGKCTVYVLNLGRGRRVVDGEQEIFRSDSDVPFFEPAELDLNGKGPKINLTLREAETVEISGTVFDAKGKPVPNAKFQYSWISRFGPIDLKRLSTDAKGQYKIQMGKGFTPYIDPVVHGQLTAFVTAETIEDYPKLVHGGVSGRKADPDFNPVTENVDHLNWELLPPETANPSASNKVMKAVRWWFSDQ